jgi:hypothetical protein
LKIHEFDSFYFFLAVTFIERPFFLLQKRGIRLSWVPRAAPEPTCAAGHEEETAMGVLMMRKHASEMLNDSPKTSKTKHKGIKKKEKKKRYQTWTMDAKIKIVSTQSTRDHRIKG